VAAVRKQDTPAQLKALAAARAAARIDPGKIPLGRTVVIATWRAGEQVHLYASRAVAGPPPACLVSAAIAAKAGAVRAAAAAACGIQVLPPPGNSGNIGNSGTSAGGTASGPKAQAVAKANLKEFERLVAKARARAASAAGAAGGSSGAGGTTGTTGNSGPVGTSGNSGPVGTSGNSGPGGVTAVAPRTVDCTTHPLPTTGNSGNSGNSGDSGNSGSAPSTAKAGSSAKN
jgi:hypothetical protein